MGAMFAWATPDYLLDYMTLEEVIFYYGRGISFENDKAETVATAIISKLNEALGGKKQKTKEPQPKIPDTPDKEAFYKHYGDQIIRPGK